MNTTYRSYRHEYTASELAELVMPPLNSKSDHPACPVCQSNSYVQEYTVGMVGPEIFTFEVGEQIPPEYLSAPLTCIYEGYDWDCPSCMVIFAGPGTQTQLPVLSKSDYMLYLKHPAWLWLKKFDSDKLPPVDAGLQAIFDAGHRFEYYAEQHFPGGVTLGFNDSASYRSLAARTRDALAAGTPTLFQAQFDNGRQACITDVVTVVGDHELDLYEIKSSTGARQQHIPDLAFQVYTIESCGYKVRNIAVMHVNNAYVRDGDIDAMQIVGRTDVTVKVRAAADVIESSIEAAMAVLALETCPDMSPRHAGSGGFGEWLEIYRSLHKLPRDSIYDLCAPGTKRIAALEDRSITLMQDIPDDFPLTPKQRAQVRAVQTGQSHINTAKIREFMDALQYPLYFLDYETFSGIEPAFDGLRPYQQVPFQYSLHIIDTPGAPLRHEEYLHYGKDNPVRPLTEALRSHIGPEGTVLAWCASFEKGCNDLLGELLPDFQPFLAGVNSRVTDLMLPFSQGYFVDKDFRGSASIKKVLPVVAPELSYKDLGIHEGTAAQRLWMQAFLANDETIDKDKLCADLLEYCGLDTLAMARIYELLREI